LISSILERGIMKRTTLKYIIDILMFVSLLGIVFIGLLLAFAMAQGPVADESTKYFLNLHRHQWGDIHLYLSLTFTALMVFHLILSWSWIKGKSKNLFGHRWRQVLSLVGATGFVIILVFWIFTPKYPGDYESYGHGIRIASLNSLHIDIPGSQSSSTTEGAEGGGTFTITGSMTLLEVAEMTGLPLKDILEEMQLPATVSSKETLGWLRKKHGISLLSFRNSVDRMLGQEISIPESRPGFPSEESREGQPRLLSVPTETAGQKTPKIPAEEELEPKLTKGRLAEGEEGFLITGQSTLREIQQSTGIDARIILKNLDLPENISLNERLGKLRRMYGFTVQDLRDVVARLLEEKSSSSFP
jgi:hypothetical protein